MGEAGAGNAGNGASNTVRKIAIAKIVFGVVGFFISFAYINHILAIVVGALLVSAHKKGTPASSSIRSLLIAELVLAIVSIVVLAALSAVYAPIFIVIRAVYNNEAPVITSAVLEYCADNTDMCTNDKTGALAYLTLALILGAIWPVFYFILALLQWCKLKPAASAPENNNSSKQSVVKVQTTAVQPAQDKSSDDPKV